MASTETAPCRESLRQSTLAHFQSMQMKNFRSGRGTCRCHWDATRGWRHPTSLFAWRGQSAGNVRGGNCKTNRRDKKDNNKQKDNNNKRNNNNYKMHNNKYLLLPRRCCPSRKTGSSQGSRCKTSSSSSSGRGSSRGRSSMWMMDAQSRSDIERERESEKESARETLRFRDA